ncbi:MAG: helix-turn-helix domain-containing protein [Myxococcaceae bacterium]|nr:helix-turn-helix domain-containing protein [Myxococcaceae bacterium]
MRRTRFQDWPCSVARTVDLLGDWWTPLVLREAFYGVRRFDDFQQGLGVARNILTERLTRLCDEGLLRKEPYSDAPLRHEYRLTDKGRAFFDVILVMMRWGDDWLSGDAGAPIELVDRATGRLVEPVVVDRHTMAPIDPRAVVARPGPGFPRRRLTEPAMMGRFGAPAAQGTPASRGSKQSTRSTR